VGQVSVFLPTDGGQILPPTSLRAAVKLRQGILKARFDQTQHLIYRGIMAEPRKYVAKEPEPSTPFFPHHVIKNAIVIYLVLGILLTLSILVPAELHEKADPLKSPIGLKPHWYFLSGYQAIKYVPKTVGILGIGLFLFILFIWPLLDHGLERNPKKRPFVTTLGIAGIIAALVLGIIGYLSNRTIHIFGKTYEISVKGVPHRIEEGKGKTH